MKRLIKCIAIILIISSCDAPRDRRVTLSSSNLSNSPASVVTIPNNSTTTTNTSNTTTNNTNSAIPSDAQQCSWATDGINGFASNSTHLGNYTLCQSTSDKNSFYFQIKTPVTTSSLCFIPTVSSSNGNSVYVGNPMCGAFTSATQVRKITFVKFPQYQSAVINGVIFFKDIAVYYPYYNQTIMTLDAYQICMNALNTGNNYYCQAFKQVGQYVYQSFN